MATRSYTTSDFDYSLPKELIAQYPLEQRSASRLLYLDAIRKKINNNKFKELPYFIDSKDLLVFNDTKVIPARLYGEKATGGRVECLVERILPEQRVLAHIRASKSPPIGSRIILANVIEARVIARVDDFFELHFKTKQPVLELLQAYGEIPLPPYIARNPAISDSKRYQTIFAKKEGAIAAPTAALHFDDPMMSQLKARGIQRVYLTLHIGAGTFQPVRTESLEQHKMHSEYMELSQEVCEAVSACRSRGGRVIAVGTTAVRSLETAARSGALKPYMGETNLFIRPGFQFNCVDALLTNFHLPKSTLLMLVTALGGYDLVMRAYQEAVKERYRFFSYGDAMFIRCA